MGTRLRYLPLEIRPPNADGTPPLAIVTLTSRTVGGEFLLRPDPVLVDRIIGLIGRAQRAHGVRIYAVQMLANHLDLVVGVRDVAQEGHFGNQVFGEIGKAVNRFRRRRGKVFERRMSVIATNGDPGDLERTLRYVLSNGVKEHTVVHALRSISVHSGRRLAQGEAMKGHWLDRDAWRRARRQDPSAPKAPHLIEYEVVHHPIPGLDHLSEAAYRERVAGWLDEDAAQAAAVRAESRRRARRTGDPRDALPEPPTAAALLRIPVTTRPEAFVKTPAPWIHARDPAVRRRYLEGLRAYGQALAANRARLLDQLRREGRDHRWEGIPPTGMPPRGDPGAGGPGAARSGRGGGGPDPDTGGPGPSGPKPTPS